MPEKKKISAEQAFNKLFGKALDTGTGKSVVYGAHDPASSTSMNTMVKVFIKDGKIIWDNAPKLANAAYISSSYIASTAIKNQIISDGAITHAKLSTTPVVPSWTFYPQKPLYIAYSTFVVGDDTVPALGWYGISEIRADESDLFDLYIEGEWKYAVLLYGMLPDGTIGRLRYRDVLKHFQN